MTHLKQQKYHLVSSSTPLGRGCNRSHIILFVLIFAVFLPYFIFLYYSGIIIQVSSKLWMFLISTPHQNVHCALAVTTNTKERVLQQLCCLDATTQESSQSVPSEDE